MAWQEVLFHIWFLYRIKSKAATNSANFLEKSIKNSFLFVKFVAKKVSTKILSGREYLAACYGKKCAEKFLKCQTDFLGF